MREKRWEGRRKRGWKKNREWRKMEEVKEGEGRYEGGMEEVRRKEEGKISQGP